MITCYDMSSVEKTWGVWCPQVLRKHVWDLERIAFAVKSSAAIDDLAPALVKSDGVYDNAWVDEVDE
jgi:hypothetical protein